MKLRVRVAALRARIPKLQTRGLTADVLAVIGATLIVVGVRDIYRPAAFLCAGVFLLVFSVALTRPSA